MEPFAANGGQILGWHGIAPGGNSAITGAETTGSVLDGFFDGSEGASTGGNGAGTVVSTTVPGGGVIDISGNAGIVTGSEIGANEFGGVSVTGEVTLTGEDDSEEPPPHAFNSKHSKHKIAILALAGNGVLVSIRHNYIINHAVWKQLF